MHARASEIQSRPGFGVHRLSRRGFLVLSAGVLVAACSPAAAPPPAKPAESKPTEAPKPAAPPSTAAPAAAQPTAAPAVSSGPVTVPFYTTENDPKSLDFFKGVGEEFKKVNQNVELKITVYQDETQLQFLTTAFQTGTDLGIFAAPAAQVTSWAKQGFLLPLDPIIQRIGPDDFLPGTRTQVDGKDYAMPFQSNASALWYRKDLFEKDGLKPPNTYEEYVAAAQALNREGILGIASTIGGAPQMAIQFFQPYIYQAGWDYYDRQGNLTFDKPPVLDAIKRYVTVMKNAAPSMYNAGYPEILNTYIAGKAAMATFPGRLGVNLEAKAPDFAEKTGVVAVPAGPVMTGKALFGSVQPYTVYAKTAHPDETLAFLEFLTTGDRELEFSMTVPGHLLPPLKSVRAKIKDYKSDYMTKHGDWVLALADMVPSTANAIQAMGAMNDGKFEKISNICPWGSAVWGNPAVDNVLFQEILIQNKDPEQAWKDASAKLKEMADKWKSENPDWKPAA
jgi:multiple sugar transport system substrate-binding protein